MVNSYKCTVCGNEIDESSPDYLEERDMCIDCMLDKIDEGELKNGGFPIFSAISICFLLISIIFSFNSMNALNINYGRGLIKEESMEQYTFFYTISMILAFLAIIFILLVIPFFKMRRQ